MTKNGKTAAVKGRETKLNKKSSEELIQIILKKDRVERNLNSQIKSLKCENNTLSTRVKNFDSDMEGTHQALESYKDRVKTLEERNATLYVNRKDAQRDYEQECRNSIVLENKVRFWKNATFIMLGVIVVGVITIMFA